MGVFPTGPIFQYQILADMVNALEIPLRHVHYFSMDEYADQDGNTAPTNWAGSFQKAMMEQFFMRIDPALRPPMSQVHFPSKKNIGDYGKIIDDLGGADVCYGGIGWCGHIAFWEADLGLEFGDGLEAYKRAGPRIVELTPMTIMQNALHSFGGDWSWVPPKAATIGPALTWHACVGELRYRGSGMLAPHGVSFSLHADVEDRVPPPDSITVLTIFKIYREAITNVIKHARASEVVAGVLVRDHEARISVEDDGKGLAPAHAPGRGLHHMRMRAEEIGASLTVASSGRTRVELVIPLPNKYLSPGMEGPSGMC